MSLSFSNAKTSYTATSSLIYPIGFTYENQSEVKVRTQLTSGAYQEVTNWSFLGTTSIQFTSTPPTTFEIYRATDISRSYGTPGYAMFRAGAQLNAGDLNKNFELLRRGIEENNAALSGLLFEDNLYFDETYVNVTGDKMTGSLVLGTSSSNNTTLAVDGSATFGSKVTTAATTSSDPSTTVTTKGYVDASVAAVPGTDLAYDSATRVVSSSTGTDATLPEVTAGGDSGLLTGADKTKLDGIETGATADQTDAEIKTAYENNADTNAFTDSEKTKLAGIASGAQVNVATDLTYTASTRLLESSTGTDVTLPEVAAAGDSGLMTGADKTKLDGIETGATADQTASELLTAIKTVDGTGSGLDADLLDGQEGSYYLNYNNLTNAPSSGLWTSSGSDIYFTGGDVGIGTTSPANPLHIANQYPGIRFQSNSGSYQGRNTISQFDNIFYIEVDNDNAVSNSALAITVDSSERMRIESSGDVVIGATSAYSGAKLTVDNSGGSDVAIALSRSGSGQNDVALLNSGGEFIVKSGFASTVGGLDERMRIDSSGNVGIGKTPADTNGFSRALDLSGSAGSALYLRNAANSANYGYVGYYSNELYIGNLVSGGNVRLFNSGAERMRIDSSGNVGIGLTAPQNRIHIASSGANPAYLHSTNASSGTGATDGVVMGLGNASDVYYWNYENGAQVWATSATERMRIDSSGNVQARRARSNTSGDVALSIQPSDSTIHYGFRIDAANNSLNLDRVDNNSTFLTLDSSGNVGIGTILPQRNLHIHSSDSSTNTYLQLTSATTGSSSTDGFQLWAYGNGGNLNAAIAQRENADLEFWTNNTERLRIDSFGFIHQKFTSNNSSTPEGLFINNQNNATGNNASLILSNDSGNRKKVAIAAVDVGNYGASDLVFALDGTDSGSVSLSSDEKMRITSSGNVGIGSSNPGGNLTITDASTYTLDIKPNGLAGALLTTIGGSASLALGTDSTEQMRITSGGIVKILGTSESLRLEPPSGTSYIAFWDGTTNAHYGFVGAANKIITGGSSSDLAVRSQANLIFSAGGSNERMRIDSSGNVGIGTTSPGSFDSAANQLVIQNSGSCGITIDATSSTNSNIYFADGDTGNERYRGTITYSHNVDAMRFGTGGGTERMRIDSSGKVLINHTTDAAPAGYASKLQLVDTSYQGSSLLIRRDQDNASASTLILAKSRSSSKGGNTIVQSGDHIGEILFFGADGNDTNCVTSMIASEVDGTPGSNDMPGRLTFHTTLDGATAPLERMRIASEGAFYQNSSSHGISTSLTASAGFAKYAYRAHYNTSAGLYSGTICYNVWSNGNVQNTNNSYGAISDSKLKENIVDASSQWDDIKNLRVRNYNFIEGQTHTQIGVVAQEVETVSPGLVSEQPDMDENDNDLGTTTKSVNYSVLYMKAVKALQEAMARIETLEQRLTDAGL